ncbi:alpha,alpha-phosphotrehalase [Amedibacillus sp. YH-ame10]
MEWWKQACIYQIYPKSFQDSNNDGIGDINGIRKRLPYLKKLGVEILWLTPMYSSPQKDNGYDIADYYAIDPLFGTMNDFDQLLEESHCLGIKIMMDIVVNHTSIEHAWFQDILKNKEKSPYYEYYIIRSAKQGRSPNNWESMFGGSAWEPLDEERYYLHLFDVTQADLNWECEALRNEIYQMMHFWLKKGVDGFRLDVINLISKQQDFLDDEESSPKGKCYYANGPRMHEFLKEMNEEVFSHYPCVSVGEMMSMDPEKAIDYTKPEHKEVNMIFSFQHLKVDYRNKDRWTRTTPDIKEMITILDTWQREVNAGDGWNSLVWSNHDQPRVVSRFGNEEKYHKESAKMLATSMHMLKGTPYIYQGEEIGMLNAGFEDIDSYHDVETLNVYKERIQKGIDEKTIMDGIMYQSRDNARTPMIWDTTEGYGFSKSMPWLGYGKHTEINVERNIDDDDSIFYHYQKLIQLRKEEDILANGEYQRIDVGDDEVWGYIRTYQQERWLILNNFKEEEKLCHIDLPEGTNIKEIIISNYRDSDCTLKDKVLRPYESIVYRLYS